MPKRLRRVPFTAGEVGLEARLGHSIIAHCSILIEGDLRILFKAL